MSGENLMIVLGGGPTAVLNASLAAAIREAVRLPGIGKIFGARHGAQGLAQGDVVELNGMTGEELELLSRTPGAALGSSRFKPTEQDLEGMIGHLRRLDVKLLLFAGGNGTMHGANVVSAFCESAGVEVRTIGVPKTIDNDLACTDRTPGYASAARYVAQSTCDLGLDLRALPQPVTILETMGRSVGWLAAGSLLAKVEEDDAPHLICVPEQPFDEGKFLGSLDRIVARQGWAVAVVAEGLRRPDGLPVYEMGDPSLADPLQRPMIGGVGQHLAGMVARQLKLRCRSEKPGLLGRASSALVSRRDREDAALVGRAAVQALMAGETGKMVALCPLLDGSEPDWELVPLAEVAGVERPIPASWLEEGPMAVTEGFLKYLRPLVGELASYAPALWRGAPVLSRETPALSRGEAQEYSQHQAGSRENR